MERLTGARLRHSLAGVAHVGGYWLVASDGDVFAFGDARFLGARGGMTLMGTRS